MPQVSAKQIPIYLTALTQFSSLLPDKTALDCLFLSMKTAVFVDGNGKMGVSSMKRAVFVDGVRDICYICMV